MLDSGTPLLSNRDIALTAEFPLKKKLPILDAHQKYFQVLGEDFNVLFPKPEARTGSSNKTCRL